MKNITITALSLVVVFSAIGFADVILQEDFETGVDGQPFPGWAWPDEQVITDNGIDGKSLMIYRSNPSLGNWGIVSPDFDPTHCLIEFDLMIDTPCVYTSDGDGGNPEVIAFYSDGRVAVGTPAGLVTTAATWADNEAFRVGVLSLEDEVTFYINGTEIEYINRDSQYSSIPVESFFFTYGSGGVALPGTIMIDNVNIIPEPASLVLLALGSLLIRRKK